MREAKSNICNLKKLRICKAALNGQGSRFERRMLMNKDYVVFINIPGCDDFGLDYHFSEIDEAMSFIKLSLANGYSCTIYEEEKRDSDG